jgi:hypothetical protein
MVHAGPTTGAGHPSSPLSSLKTTDYNKSCRIKLGNSKVCICIAGWFGDDTRKKPGRLSLGQAACCVLAGHPGRGTRFSENTYSYPACGVAFRKRVPEAEIAEDFPALDPRDLAYARLVARFGARPGRPKKRLVFKREHEVAG